MRRAAGLIVGLTLMGAGAAAAPINLMGCTFKGGQSEVLVSIQDGVVTYAYGRVGQEPELVLTDAVIDVDYTPWPGAGSAIWEEISFENKGFYYLISMYVPREPGNPAPGGGLFITHNDVEIAKLSCDPGSVTYVVDGLDRAKYAAGRCYENQEWVHCAQ